MNFRAIKIQRVSLIEQGRWQHQIDPIEIVVLPKLPGDCQNAGMGFPDDLGTFEQMLHFRRVGDLLHAVRHRSVRDDFSTLKELVPPNVVSVFVRVDYVFRHALPDLPEQFNHLACVGQIRLRIDDNTSAQIDES